MLPRTADVEHVSVSGGHVSLQGQPPAQYALEHLFGRCRCCFDGLLKTILKSPHIVTLYGKFARTLTFE